MQILERMIEDVKFSVLYWRNLAAALRRSGINKPDPSTLERCADNLEAITGITTEPRPKIGISHSSAK